MMNINDIGFAYVSYNGAPGGKKRPVLILSLSEDEVEFFSITSQYHTKSEQIKAQYFKIENWTAIGLPKESWIDIGSRRQVDLADIEFDFVGTLPVVDVRNLEEFIINYITSKK